MDTVQLRKCGTWRCWPPGTKNSLFSTEIGMYMSVLAGCFKTGLAEEAVPAVPRVERRFPALVIEAHGVLDFSYSPLN